jgi:hypothetical protein
MDGLLDQAVEHRGDAKQADSTALLGDLLPAYRQGLMSPLQQGPLGLVPVPTDVATQLRGLPLIDAGRSSVALDPLEGFEHVLPLTDNLHEPVFSTRAFRQSLGDESIMGPIETTCGQPAELHLHLHCIHHVPTPTLPFSLLAVRSHPPSVQAFDGGDTAWPIRLLRLSALKCLTSLA